MRFCYNPAGVTLCYNFVGGSFCCNHAGDCFCCNYAALDVSAALMWVTVFIVIMQVRVPVANYAGDIFCIMHMTVSIAIMLLTVSVMVMHVTVSSNNFKFPLFKKLTKCFLDRPLKGGDILDF